MFSLIFLYFCCHASDFGILLAYFFPERRISLWKNLFPLKNFPKRNSANLTQSEEKTGTELTPLQENPKTRKHITEKGHKTETTSILCPFVFPDFPLIRLFGLWPKIHLPPREGLFGNFNGNAVDFNAFVRRDHDIFSSVHDLGFNKVRKFRSDGNFDLGCHNLELFAFDYVLGF